MKCFAALVLTLLVFPVIASSQISITTLGPAGAYTQNFAFLGTVDFPLTNNGAGNPGIYATRTIGNATPNSIVASTGTIAAGDFYNFGAAGSADRTLGSQGGAGVVHYGVRIQNDTGTTVGRVRVQYTGEQWRDTSTTPQTLAFSYQTDTGDINSLVLGTYLTFAPLAFTSPTNVNDAGGPIDGNVAPNRTVFDVGIIVNLPTGSEIMLRWSDANDGGGGDQGLGVDDLTVTLLAPTAAGVSVSGQVRTASGVGIGGATLVLSGGTLTGPLVARTNPFGYYQFDDVPAGGTYLVEISSKRYSFPQPSQVISAQDSVTGLDFIADGK